MRSAIRVVLVGLACVGVSLGAVYVLSDPDFGGTRRRPPPSASATGPAGAEPFVPRRADAPGPPPIYSEYSLDDSGFKLATGYQAAASERITIAELRDAIEARSGRGLAQLAAERAELEAITPRDADTAIRLAGRESRAATLHMHRGEFAEADARLARALELTDRPEVPPEVRSIYRAMRGIAALRRGEAENCVACLGPSSCIVPIAPEAVHQFPSGSRAAVEHFSAYLRERPEDLGVRWLLNVAYMTLGEYPRKVPKPYLIPIDSFGSPEDVGRFPNVAAAVGLGARGSNLAGGAAFDDFTGDGLPDVFVASYDPRLGAGLFVNRGDGTFDDRSGSPGLADQVLAVNCTHADYDNDGDLDVLLLRGGWERPAPLSLLRNEGDGSFKDVAAEAGLGTPIASQSAAWGDYDLDGLLDLYVAGESMGDATDAMQAADNALRKGDRRNFCRLYRNNGDGTFADVAEKAGVLNDRYAKGVAWGDYDGDGDPDLLVSNMGSDDRLYRNNGDGTFADVAPALGVTGPRRSFACWFWDFDNDGRLDLYLTGYGGNLNDYVADQLGRPSQRAERPRLYRNLGAEGFADVTASVGLDRVFMPMGANVGDIDEDGFLDVYLATGRPAYSMLVPNVLLKNDGGRGFRDVTASSGTGHLQKGHAVSFADFDSDGDLDLFAQLGGAVPGDRAHNALFRNPGHGRHTLGVRLIGRTANRSALGAKIRAEVAEADGSTRSIYREVGPGSSFGGNSLAATIGLGAAAKVSALEITWPNRDRTRQVFRDIPADRTLEITEGDEAPKVRPLANHDAAKGR